VIRPAGRWVDERGGMDYLGGEFLTWLWWRSSTKPEFRHPDGSAVYVHVDEHLELRGERGAARRTILRAGLPGASAEAKAALRNGKTVAAARLLFARGEEEIALTLRGDDLDVSGVRLPAPEGKDAEDRLTASLDRVERLYADLDLCLRAFLEVRCSPRWEEEVAALRAWGESPSEEERQVVPAPEASPA
jgi:hypothetical protein